MGLGASAPENGARGARACPVHAAAVRAGHGVSAAVCARGQGGEPVGWQRWRRQLREQTREQVIVFAPGDDGILQLAEYSMLLGAKLKDGPPGLGTLPEVLARYKVRAHG